MSENTRSSKKRKAIAATLTVAMAATMLLSGTLAYFYRSTAVNQFDGVSQMKKVVGHDDFDPVSGNKDVYLENLGEAPVYVRIRLSEDFKISDAGVKDLPETYYTSPGLTRNNRYEEVVIDEETGETLGGHNHGLMADPDAEADFAAGDDPEFHKTYFKWTMGGAGSQKTYLSGNSTEYVANDGTAPKYKDADAPLAGETEGTLRVVYDTTNTAYEMDTSNDDIKTTPAQGEIITLSEWATYSPKEKCEHVGWIFDDTSEALTSGRGWYYWSQPVEGGQSTGLLLDHVETLTALKDGDYTYDYHIHVEFEAVNETDKGLWSGQQSASTSGDPWKNSDIASQSAVKFLDFISGKVQRGDQFEELCRYLSEKDQAYQALHDSEDAEAKKEICYEAWGLVKQAITSLNERVVDEAFALYREALTLEAAYDPETYTKEILFSQSDTEGESPAIDPVFFAYLVENFDLDEDGAISKAEGRTVRNIQINPYKAEGVIDIKNLNALTNDNFPNLKYMKIRLSNIASVSADNLPKKLEGICLTDCPLTAFNAAQLPKLKSISLSKTDVSNDTFLVAENNRIVDLDIRDTKITNWSMRTTPYVEMLQLQGDALETIDLSGLKGKPIVMATGPLPSLKKLDVSVLDNVKAFPLLVCTGIGAVVHTADQTFAKGIPAEADYVRLASGLIKGPDGTEYTDAALDEKLNASADSDTGGTGIEDSGDAGA